MASFRGFQLPASKKVNVGENDENGLIHLTNACLAAGDKAELFCTVNGVRLIVAVFQKNGVEHQKLNLRFDTSDDNCVLESVGGDIHVTGFFEDMDDDMMPGMDMDMDEDISEEDLKALMAASEARKAKVVEANKENAKQSTLVKEAEKKKADDAKAQEAKIAEQKKAKALEAKKAEEKKAEEEMKAEEKKAQEKKAQEKKAQEKKAQVVEEKKKNEATPSNAEFIPSKKFTGAKAGYVFKKDKKGLGYYKDTYVAPKGQKRNAEEQGGGAKKILTLMGGVKAEVTRSGQGAKATKGKNVTVKYDGRLTNGKRFDKGSIRFRLGGGEVIKGWDVGVEGMLVGEKRKLLIPPKFAYGKQGAPPDIPPNATLAFDVELVRM